MRLVAGDRVTTRGQPGDRAGQVSMDPFVTVTVTSALAWLGVVGRDRCPVPDGAELGGAHFPPEQARPGPVDTSGRDTGRTVRVTFCHQ